MGEGYCSQFLTLHKTVYDAMVSGDTQTSKQRGKASKQMEKEEERGDGEQRQKTPARHPSAQPSQGPR